MEISIIGNRGSGKTSLLALLATRMNDKPIYSNFWLDLPNFKPLRIYDLLNLPTNIYMFLDEGYTWLESRTSMSELNRYISYLLFQSRKRSMDIYLTAQLFSTVDKRFREQADYIVECYTRYDLKNDDFYYKVNESATYRTASFMIPYELMQYYFDVFDTDQIIEPHRKDIMEFHLVKDNAGLLFEQTEKIAPIILKYLIKEYGKESRITKDKVEEALLRNEIHTGYKKYIWLFLNKKNANIKNNKNNNAGKA